MKEITKVKLHGILGKQVGGAWNVAVKSVSEAMHAINILSGQKLYKFLKKNDENNIRYKVLINDNQIITNKELNPNDIETIRTSEYCIKKSIKTIDVVPVLEGADSNGGTLATVIGVALIVVGIIFIATPIGVPLIIAGLGLVVAGVYTLLSKPPDFEDFREETGRVSYLFNGPTNVSREGGPVPVGYGRLIVGSQVASATYEISNIDSEDEPSKLRYYSI